MVLRWGFWVMEGVWECVSGVGVGCHGDMICSLTIVDHDSMTGSSIATPLFFYRVYQMKSSLILWGTCNRISLFADSLLIAVSTTSFRIQNVTTSLHMNSMLLLRVFTC
jgi:hypothetical protein